ncbi:MAG TPA: hypothetical protein VIV07_06855 [Sphingomicrobium sp.]
MRLRIPVITFVLLIAVAACGKRDPVASDANKVTDLPGSPRPAPSPAGEPPANQATAPATQAETPRSAIPAALQGRWGLAPADCTGALAAAKGLLVISGDELRFYESRAVPADGVQTDSQSISGNFNFSGEGQSWSKFETLELQKGKLVRTESNPTASFTYAKC